MTRLAVIAACCALGAGATGSASSSSSSALPYCRLAQLKLTGSLQGATQSLLGTLTVTNRAAQACALPIAPRRVTLRIGTQVLPTLTVRMSPAMEPPGLPTRKVAGRERVFVGIQWRNWCGRPRGRVRLSVELTIYNATPRTPVGRVRTPVCANHKFTSKVSVSRFKISP
jgi:hypothetical protein